MFQVEYAVRGEDYTRTRGRSPVREVAISIAQRLIVKHGQGSLDWVQVYDDDREVVVYEWDPSSQEGGLGAAA